jgi:hypothetical protein
MATKVTPEGLESLPVNFHPSVVFSGIFIDTPEAELKGSIREALEPLIERKLRREIQLVEKS